MRSPIISAIALFALALCSFEAKATTIIAVWTPNSTFIAADGKASHSSENSAHETICKINVANNVFWAAAGLTQDTSTGYSVGKLVNEAMKQSLPLEKKKIASFEISATKALTAATSLMFKNYRSVFDKNISHSAALEVTFSSYENGINYLFALSFSAYFDPESNAVKVYTTENTSCPCGKSHIQTMGFHSIIDAELRGNPGAFDTPTENAAALKRLIELQIVSSPKAVGPPISIVEIQKGIPHWIDKGACKPN